MIDKTLFDRLREQSGSKLDYEALQEIWDQFLEVNQKKRYPGDMAADEVQLAYLNTIVWGHMALIIPKDQIETDGNYTRWLMGLLCLNISNTTLAVLKLSLDGLQYQAAQLLYSLCEACFMLLNIMIDREKSCALYEASLSEDACPVWRTYFNMYAMNETLSEYEKRKMAGYQVYSVFRQRKLKRFFNYVHNNLFRFCSYSYLNPDENLADGLHLNLWGRNAGQSKIFSYVNDLLWYTGMMMDQILADADSEITEQMLYPPAARDCWDEIRQLRALTDAYAIQTRERYVSQRRPAPCESQCRREIH